MSYDTIEAAALTVLRLHADYSSTNTSRGDYRILGGGLTRGVVLTPSSVLAREVVAAPRQIRTVWVINIDLFISFTAVGGEQDKIADAIRADRQNIIDQFDKYPTLNGATGIIHAIITSALEPEKWTGQSRNWWSQRMQMQVEERVQVSIAE